MKFKNKFAFLNSSSAYQVIKSLTLENFLISMLKNFLINLSVYSKTYPSKLVLKKIKLITAQLYNLKLP